MENLKKELQNPNYNNYNFKFIMYLFKSILNIYDTNNKTISIILLYEFINHMKMNKKYLNDNNNIFYYKTLLKLLKYCENYENTKNLSQKELTHLLYFNLLKYDFIEMLCNPYYFYLKIIKLYGLLNKKIFVYLLLIFSLSIIFLKYFFDILKLLCKIIAYSEQNNKFIEDFY